MKQRHDRFGRDTGGEFVRLGGLPPVGQLAGLVHVFPVEGGRTPLAGPFESASAARLWVVQHLESQLTPAQLEVWAQVLAVAAPATDGGKELGLIDMVRHGRTFAQIQRYIERRSADRPPAIDRRMAAAGDGA